MNTAATDIIAAEDVQSLSEWTSHEGPDSDRVAELADAMQANGWQGAPILTYQGLAITGTHRIAAARESETMVPVLDLTDVMDDADECFERVMEVANASDTAEVIAWLFRRALGDAESERLGNDLDTRGMEDIWGDALD